MSHREGKTNVVVESKCLAVKHEININELKDKNRDKVKYISLSKPSKREQGARFKYLRGYCYL